MAMVDHYMQRLIANREIPGTVLAVLKDGEQQYLKSYGSYLDRHNRAVQMTTETIFDIASLTKIMATLPAILLLIDQNEIALDDAVKKYVPQFNYSEVTIQYLLQHRSGLPSGLPFKHRGIKRDVMKELFETPLIYSPGTLTVYSDLGMILLGKVIEVVTGQRLNKYCNEAIFKPWGLTETTFLPSSYVRERIATTEWFQEKYIQGEVHDEKAYQLKGVSGSAGLFSTVDDISTYAQYWLYPETQTVLSPEIMIQAYTDTFENRGLGFEVWQGSGETLACGRHWPIGSFGHTGFTGTSVWMDPIEKLAVVLLTNVVHINRNLRIQTIREKVHTLIRNQYIGK